jgi:23S rRNA (cytidine1920-2'-O)/16S rRNA (cytidine1409-2'-O)-methyltransferase
VDASFIGLDKLAEALRRTLRAGGTLVALVKPQFEVGRVEASRGRGVVRDPEVRARAVESGVEALRQAGFDVTGVVDSVLAGPRGNVEAFVHAPLRGGK